jgi:hypothetical protein
MHRTTVIIVEVIIVDVIHLAQSSLNDIAPRNDLIRSRTL